MNSSPSPRSLPAPPRARSFSWIRYLVSCLVLAPLMVLPSGYALPTGAQVVAGNVAIAQAGAQMTLDQTSRNAIVNWQSFNIGAGEQLRLNQGSANAAMLARVTGNDPSQLLGSLKADGKLFLINPKGIVVGQGAVIDTAAFMASTLDVSDTDFLRGAAMTFKGDSTAGIVNLGQITAHEGNVMLFAHTVQNAGEISAPRGTASLAAGSEVYLGSPDDSSVVIKFNLPSSVAKSGVENSGVIAAAQAELKAAGGSIYEVAINQSGVVRATGVENKNGRILLTADGGTVGVSGTVTARNADGSGGEILVGGDYRGGNKDIPNAARTVVTATAKLDASATTSEGKAGRVIAWSDEATRFLGGIDAHGAGGGFAEVSGKHFLDFNPAATVSLGANGTLLLDPDALIVSSSADSGTATSGTNPFTFSLNTDPATLNVTTLQNQLATSNVILDTSLSAGDITFNNAVTWAANNSLTAKAGGSININANLTGGATSTIELRPGKAAMPQLQGFNPINPKATLAAAATITTGTLVYGSNPDAAPAGYTINGPTSAASFDGNLNVGTLQVDLSTGATGIGTFGSDNTIGAFRTLGTGDLSFAHVVNHHGNLATKLTTSGSTANQVLVATPGTLSLESGSSVSFASPASVILSSTNAGINNQAGGAVFGANANYLIYGVSTAATTKGGLTAGDVFSTTFDLNDPVGGFTGLDRFLYRAAGVSPVLTYTADSLSRSYGSANPAFTFSVTGIVGGITNDVTGTPSFSTTATQNSGVGGYAINIGQGSLLSTTSHYTFAFAPGTLTITAAPLTITANNNSRTLFGANPAFSASYSGFVLGEDSSVVSGLNLATTATGGSPIGNYPITPSGATAPNYAIAFVPGTLSVTDLSILTITANNASRLYGAANPAFTASYSGFVGSDTSAIVSGLQFATTAGQASGVGTYTITPFGAVAPGYNLNYQPGTLTIDRAPLTLFPQNVARLYGDANPALSFSASGLVLGDTIAVVSGVTLNTSADATSRVGTYPVTGSGGTAANYAVSFAGSATLTVNPAPLTVRFDDQSRVYGDPDPAFTYSVSGFKNGDNASIMNVSSISSGASLTSPAGSSFGIGGTAFASTSNYVTNVVLGNLAITPRPLTITADNKTKVYGDANPELTATFSGLASFDTPASIAGLNLTTEATQTSGVSNFGIIFTLGHNPNYAITSKFGTLAITPAPLSLLPPPDVARIYGRADPTLPALNFGGLKNSDTIAGLVASYVNLPAPTADAGTYTYGVAIKNSNYRLTGATTGLFRVDPAPLDVQVAGDGRTYGDANPTSYTVNAQGLAFGQTADQVLRVVNATDQATGVGIYDLTARLLSKNYYFNSLTPGKFQINPRLLSFAIDNVARYYGDTDPDFTYTLGLGGLAPSDNVASIISGFKTAQPIGITTDVGLYRIDPIFKANPNYLVSWTPSYLAILPRPIELTINNAIAFGNDNVPVGFDTAGAGVDLVHPPIPGHPGDYTGFTATATNLPANVSLKDVYPSMQFSVNDTNDPQPVQTAVDLSSVFPKATATAPQATTAAVSPSAPASTALPATVIATIDAMAPVDTTIYAVIGGKVVKNPTAAEAVLEKFVDKIFYVSPTTFANGNYAVTKITNGLLTFKADPDVVRINVEIALKKDQRDAATKEFANDGKNGAFGLPPDMFTVLRELLGWMLNDALNSGDTGPGSLYYEINGSSGYIFTGDQTQEDKFLFWLADIHTNTLKQAELLPGLLTYVMNIAGRDPKTWSDADTKLVTFMTPYVQQAQEDYAKQLAAEKAAWLAKQNSAKGAVDFMMGTTDEYTEVISNAIADVSKSATDKMSAAVKGMVDNAKTTVTSDFASGPLSSDVKVFVVDSVRVAGAGAGVAGTGALVKFALANSNAVGTVNRLVSETEGAMGEITAALKDSINISGIDTSKMVQEAGTEAAQLLKDKLADPGVVKEMNDAYKSAYDAFMKNPGAKVADAEKAAQQASEDVATKYGDSIMKQAIDKVQSQAESALSDRSLKVAQDAFDQAVKDGKSATEANQIAEFEKQEFLKKSTGPADLESQAEEQAQKAFTKALSEGKSSNEANQLADFAKQDFEQKATQAKTLENQALDKGQEAFEIALKQGKSATEAGQIAEQAQQDFVEKSALDKGQEAFNQALKEGKSATQANEIAETVKSEAMGEAKNLLKTGTVVGEEVAEDVAKTGAKVSATVGEKIAESAAKSIGTVAVKSVTTGIEAAEGAARIASMAEMLALGPGAVIELAVQVAIQAGSSAAERADQESRLNNLINNGDKPVDLHAMATDQDGRAVMMMGLLKMFAGSSSSTTVSVTP